MQKYSIAVGVVVFFVSLFVMIDLLGPLTCNNGWESVSIGLQGACSHHGGVDHTKTYLGIFLSLIVASISIFVSYKILDTLDDKVAEKRWKSGRPKTNTPS